MGEALEALGLAHLSHGTPLGIALLSCLLVLCGSPGAWLFASSLGM